MPLSFWIDLERGRVHAHRENCWRQPRNPVDQYAFRALLTGMRPDGLLYSLKLDSIASRRRVPCFRLCLGLFIHVQL
jgi:hypothetical protein